MSVKNADAKRKRLARKKKEEAKKDPLAPKKIQTSFDNAFINLSSDVLLRHFTNKFGHDIYVVFDRKLNMSDGDMRKQFVTEAQEEINDAKHVTYIRVNTKKKVVESSLLKEKDLQVLVVSRYLSEKKKFAF